jgi:hypothetical protein
MGEGMTYEEWQGLRIKNEVKSFMKQLISEVGCRSALLSPWDQRN